MIVWPWLPQSEHFKQICSPRLFADFLTFVKQIESELKPDSVEKGNRFSASQGMEEWKMLVVCEMGVLAIWVRLINIELLNKVRWVEKAIPWASQQSPH